MRPMSLAPLHVCLGLLLAQIPPTAEAAAPKAGAEPEQAQASALPPREPGLNEHAVVEFTLPNGLLVVLSEAHDRSEIFGAMVVRAGSRDDPPDDTGMAHYLEHMLFKGTRRLGTTDFAAEAPLIEELANLYEAMRTASPAAIGGLQAKVDAIAKQAGRLAAPGELDRILSELGAENVNAFTHPDMTVYYNAFAASQVEAWLALYAERFVEPVFRLFPSELETVYEEKNRAMDGFFFPAYEAFIRAFFPDHTYGTHSPLGSVEHLKRPSIRAMEKFFAKHYVASNMALVLVGDFDGEQLRAVIEREFSRLPGGPVPAKDHGRVEAFSGVKQETVRVTPLRAGALAFRTPVMGEPGYAATKVLLSMISNSQKTGLLDRLVQDGDLLMAMNFELDFHEHNGSILAYAPRILTQSFADAERKIMKGLALLGDTAPRATWVEASRDNVLRDIELRWEDHEQRALLLADLAARGITWSDYLSVVAEIRATTPTQIQAAAKQHFGANRLEIRSRMGKPERHYLTKPKLSPLQPRENPESSYYRAFAGRSLPPPSPRIVDFERDIVEVQTPSGVDLRANANPFNDIYRLELQFGIGSHDLEAAELLATYLERAGAESLANEDFVTSLYGLATTLEAIATPERFVIRIQGPQREMESALEVVAALVSGISRDRKTLRRIRLEEWATERALRSQPIALADALWEHVVYGYRSRFHREGSRAHRRISLQELHDAWDEIQRHAVEVHYVGREAPDEVANAVASIVKLREASLPAVAPRVRPSLLPKAAQVVFVPRRKSVQTQVRLYVASDPVATADLPRMHAFHQYFGGSMAGLVFQEVREQRALAYSAHGGFEPARHEHHPGYTYIALGCQADKTEEALQTVYRLLENMPNRPRRVPSLQRALTHRQETDDPFFRELQTQVEAWQWLGARGDPRSAWIEAYERLTADDIVGFWREQVRDRPVVLMIVGDPAKIEKSTLERFGPVQRVGVDRLYRP